MCAVGANHHIVRTVEFLAFKVIGENCVFPIRRDSNDGAQYAGTINQSMLLVVSIAIGIAERNQFFFVAVQKDAVNFVLNLVAYVDEAGLIPHRPFGETKICRNL